MHEMQNLDILRKTIAASRLIDLSYTYEVGMPSWPTHARYAAEVCESYDKGSLHYTLTLGEHAGTHIDAPAHFIPGGKGIDETPLNTLMGRGVMIDASFLQPKQAFTLAQLQQFEAAHGAIEKGDIVLLRFGWEDRYGINEQGKAFLQDWPGLSGEAAAYLAEKGVNAVGCDALALDPFGSETYPCHGILLGQEIPILENVCNLKSLPTFSYVIGLWNKFKGGSASPLRLVALV